MDDADNIIDIVAKVDQDSLSAVYSTLVVEYIRKGNVDKALNIFDTSLGKHKYKLNEYFDVLVELAVHNYEKEFHRVHILRLKVWLFDATNLQLVLFFQFQELQDFQHPTTYNHKVPIYISKLIALGKPNYAYAVLTTMSPVNRQTGSKLALSPFFISNLVRYDVVRIIKLLVLYCVFRVRSRISILF